MKSYALRTRHWLDKHGCKRGTKVRIKYRKLLRYFRDWEGEWTDEMTDCYGMTGIIYQTADGRIADETKGIHVLIPGKGVFMFPFQALEVLHA